MLGKSRKKIIKTPKKEIPTELPKFAIREKGEKPKLKPKKSSILKAIITFIIIIALVVIGFFIVRSIDFGVTEMIWKTTLTKGSDEINNKSVSYRSFNNGLIRISNDGTSFIDSTGTIKWTVSYNIKEPLVDSRNDIFVVADRNSNEFYLFDKNGKVSSGASVYPLQKVSISKDGKVYFLQGNENISAIDLYDKNGKNLDLEIVDDLSKNGMPVDISSSRDGSTLSIAYTCLSGIDIYSKAVYQKFEDVVKTRKKIGEFTDEFKDHYLAKVHYFDDSYSSLFYDGGIYFAVSDGESVKMTGNVPVDDVIKSLSCNDNIVALVTEGKRLLVYGKTGVELSHTNIDFDYDNFYVSDDYIVFINANKVIIYDERCSKIFDRDMDHKVEYVSKKKSLLFTELLVGYVDKVECIRFY